MCPPDVFEHIFEPFYTTKPKGRGTGLGMSMAYGFAKQSNGDLKVYSEVGVGTTVRLYLPFTEEQPRPKDEQTEADGLLAGKPQGDVHILVVEDDDEVRELVIELLSDHGYTVEATTNGKDAIELLQQGRTFDLIVSDVVMPGEADGVAVARAARAIDHEQAILFCSGFPRRTLDDAEFRDHRVHFLGKPYRIEELANTVHHIIGK